LDLARAMALRAQGQTALALAMFDRVAAGADRLASARAAVAAIGLRLASHALTPAQAAAAMDRQLYAWRGDDRELALREHEAALWAKAGQWRRSLALLRATTALRPDQADALHARLAATFAAAVAADARTPLPPLDLVALADENADLIAPGEPGRALAARLADRLIALDLPDRAIPVLARLAAGAPSGPARGEFGLRLARLRLSQGDAPGALDALTQSHSSGLPAPLHAARTLVFARAAAAAGDLPSATAALVALGGDAADALRADLLETAKDWPAAEAALRTLAARRIPPAGVLTDAQLTTLLRLASAAAQAGDEATLADLRQRMEARLPAGKQADMFRLLTAGPVQGVADLPRAALETQLARALPADLTSLTP
ncbi:MAG: hypothetical protein KGJ41_14010, partial [Rhodospirillales bacterium]|nr:hypothetical protein [Rhodospirillales bacterium]